MQCKYFFLSLRAILQPGCVLQPQIHTTEKNPHTKKNEGAPVKSYRHSNVKKTTLQAMIKQPKQKNKQEQQRLVRNPPDFAFETCFFFQ